MTDTLHPPLSAHLNEPKISSERNFGLVFAAVFALISVTPLLHGHPARIWSLPIAGVFLVTATFRPRLLAPLNRFWFRLGIALGKIVTPVMMSVLFFVVVTPVALLMRIAGKDPLLLKRDPSAVTYWVERSRPLPPAGSFKDQF
ncbi:MAG: hypothetical protein KGQ47_14345 [Hyphomicrobiales bacterium]|jgi:Saxitoxin biosynthesis operon protein SxtJ|nr:hypothetical protein [Hyphomicrobiales bacterium]MDE1971915.1 hypothetical protein [Hyphomicrobiales bacterium]